MTQFKEESHQGKYFELGGDKSTLFTPAGHSWSRAWGKVIVSSDVSQVKMGCILVTCFPLKESKKRKLNSG